MAFWIWTESFRSANWWLQKNKRRVDEIHNRELQRCKAVRKTNWKTISKTNWKTILSLCLEFSMIVKFFNVQKTFHYNWKTTSNFFWNKQFFFVLNFHTFSTLLNVNSLNQKRWRLESTHWKWNIHSTVNYNWIKNKRHEKNKLWQNSSSAINVFWIR